MTQYSKRASLRRSFGQVLLARKSTEPAKVARLKGRYRFRAAVRLVLEYVDWLTEESTTEGISDDFTFGVRERLAKRLLRLEERSTLLIHPLERSESDKEYVWEIFKKLRAFKKYSDDLRKLLANLCFYQYISPNRVIVRQNGSSDNLYFIVDGEVNVSRTEIDEYTGEVKNVDMGTMVAGDMFGEVALLHSMPRTATIISKTTVELLFISRDDFDNVLRSTLMKEWNVLQDALVHFNYFKGWDGNTIRECCVLSRIEDFKPNEIILGDGRGMVNHVHFILDGSCRLIEHILVRKRDGDKTTTTTTMYELYNPEESASGPRTTVTDTALGSTARKTQRPLNQSDYNDVIVDDARLLFSTMSLDRTNEDRTSVTTATLQDVINEWHAISNVAEMLMREPSVTSWRRYSDDVRTIFMDVCVFRRGACFGLGEEMNNRRIVATTSVKCLLIPRHWLLERNRANIWERVKLYIDSKYPSRETLFRAFVNDQKWKKCKKRLVDEIRRRTGKTPLTNVTIHDVPYSSRIREIWRDGSRQQS